MLKSLEISGFKSFAKKTSLEFKSKVTAIVGPNGSGKSNVAEAFRFVLGEQSIKSMRGKRGEDLLWSGSSEVTKANRGGAKLVFNNSPKKFDLDFDEIVIERVVNRDGSNEYFLNGSQVRLKDIFELLSQAHIGASSHHIISQGEADRILSASIKERREMIEDALGLKIYQYKREESTRKLQKTEENIKQVESLRREIAPHIKFLKKQVEKTEKAEELRLKLSLFYKEYLRREKIYLEKEKEDIEKQKRPILDTINRLDREMDEAKDILNASSQKDEKSTVLIEVEDKIKAVRDERDKLSREMGKIEGELSANQRNIERVRQEQEKNENKTVPLKEVENLEKEISVLSEISEVLNRIHSFISKHRDTVDDKILGELLDASKNLENEKNQIETKSLKTNLDLNNLEEEYQNIKKSIEKEKDSSREAEKNIFKISAEQSEVRARLDSLKEKEYRLGIEENDWKREIQEGGVLLGTAIIGFENFQILNETQVAILEDEIRSEPRKNQEERRRELEKMKIRLEELGGVAEGAEIMKEYQEVTERDTYLTRELEDLNKSAESLNILIKELFEKLDIEFKIGIEKINKAFNEYFVLMFGGGEAKLTIEKLKIKRLKNLEEDIGGIPEEETDQEGLDISVSLPRKRIKGLEMLSGGERALTSIALLFAVSQVNPPPFIILDETDAALDEANSKKYGDMIESLSKYSQLILITHNRETMSRAGVIYGVTMGRDGVSRLLSIAFDEAVAVAK